mmetsp:Transcript_6102/g.8731  ORF Transcript_6102/g.8731 Transcript_6102/m.8731 type:complete len:182 (+) Transcript_6102:221-766(+)
MSTNRQGDDIEQNEETRAFVGNPYSNTMKDPNLLPARHPYNIIKRSVIMGSCLWGLHEFKVYHNVMKSPHVRHEWFKIGVVSSIAILFVKAYVEMYAGQYKKQKVNYENFRQSTHAIMLLILLASLSFNLALWPQYGGFKTMVILTMFGFGILLQFALLFPSYIQNPVSFILLILFLVEYK